MSKKITTKAVKVAEVYVVNDYNKGLEHDYDVLHNNDTDQTILNYSNHEYWDSELHNTCAGSLWDDGDSVGFTIDDVKFSLDYDQMERLTALILSCNQSIMELRESKVVASLNKVK